MTMLDWKLLRFMTILMLLLTMMMIKAKPYIDRDQEVYRKFLVSKNTKGEKTFHFWCENSHCCVCTTVFQKKQSKSTKRKTRQAKALENAKKAPRTFLVLELLNEANLESLPHHVPSYLRAAVGPPSSVARDIFALYVDSLPIICVRCGTRFCSTRCQNIHNDTRCLKFVA